MKIVIPGGSGQVGTVLARAFSSRGDEVVVLSRQANNNGRAPWAVYSKGKVALVYGDESRSRRRFRRSVRSGSPWSWRPMRSPMRAAYNEIIGGTSNHYSSLSEAIAMEKKFRISSTAKRESEQ